MLTFKTFIENLQVDVKEILEDVGATEIETSSDYINAKLDTKEQIEEIFNSFPEDVDFEIEVYNKESGEEVESIDEEDEVEITLEDIDDSKHEYELYVYLYNTESDEQMDEVRRHVKIDAKGKRKIRMRCKPGFKWTGSKCAKIGGKELLNKRKGIRKAIRTKKAKGKGAQRKANILRRRAMKKRGSMGLKNRK